MIMGSGGECINLIRFHICPPLHILLKHVYTSKISYLRTYTPTHSILAYSHFNIQCKIFEISSKMASLKNSICGETAGFDKKMFDNDPMF